ncbi:MAG: DUF4423 domain-containing protein, partial [Proteobacteria bacterium]|nr:DUF4423 domain-containing protein [Pseudomonadota bacterium]
EHKELKKTFSRKSNFAIDYKLADPQQIATQWYHYAILSLMETSGFKSSEAYIAKRLGIPVTKVRAAVDDLVNCKLISKESKQWKLLSSNTTTVTDIPSAIIRDSQKTSMRRTIDRLDDIDLNLRDVSSITMAIDSSKIPQAKSAIREFRRSLAKLLETGKQDEVYELNIQLMPMTIKEKE